MEDYERLFFAIDFDGTIVTNKFPKIGEIKKDTISFMKKIHKAGHCIIIWTCRSGDLLEEMKEFLRKNKIPYDYINENPENSFGDDTRKLFANYYIDDRAVNVEDIKKFKFRD
jgi:hypothetical protein